MDNLDSNVQVDNSLFNNREINDYLLETAKWGKFLAIMGYIGMGFMIIAGIFMMVGLSLLKGFSGEVAPTSIIGLVYFVIAALYFFPVTYLYRFSTQIKEALYLKNEQSLTYGFQNLKSLFKFMGIFTIVILSIYVLAIIIAIPTALMFR